MKIVYSKTFKKSLERLTQKQKKRAIRKINLFIKNPHSTPLKTHKLSGKLQNYWSFSIEYNSRVLYKPTSNEQVEFVDIGTHGIYK